ncbi:MAG: ComEC family competence protein [Alphaproteobacteria bacterium]|nr:ComEC family competence protein [Alphaproteobacteria bacterium]
MNLALSLFAFCTGIAIYFALPFEPTIAYPLLISIFFAIGFIIWNKKLIAPVFALLFGLFYSIGWTRAVDIPRITHSKYNTEISGVVKNIDYTPDKTRLFLQDNKNGAIYRLSASDEILIPNIGDNITITASIFPPAPANVPNGFDFAKWAYFDGISATGYITNLKIDNSNANLHGIASLREKMNKKFNSKLFDSLVLGYKHTLPDTENKAWNAAGVGHVFSISGFHISLVGGWLFILFYSLFRLIPWITKRTSARYPAMICSFFGLLFYLFLSGADVATQRAFLTTSLMFAAFIFGRNVFTMRNTAIVFTALLIANPNYLTAAGFQLSFAAIFGLIWFFGDTKYDKVSFIYKIWRAVKIMIMTTFIATIFTMPFIAYHFHTIQIYSLLGNLLCLPIFSILIMPLTMLGLTSYATAVYDWTLKIANWISSLPFAGIQIPTISSFAFYLMVIGLICLVMIKNKKIKVISVAICFLIPIILTAIKPKPIFYTTHDNELIAVVLNGKLHFNRNKSSKHFFAFDTWKQNNFEKTGTPNKRIKCKKGLCLIQTEKWSLAYTQKFMPLLKNAEQLCIENDFLVSYLKIVDKNNCQAKILRGGFVIYKNGHIEYINSNRWWHNQPK